MTAQQAQQNVIVNSALGLMGPTGAGKSSLIATAATYLWETRQQVLLLYSASGGGFPTKVQSLVKLGIIRLWRMRTRGEAFESCMRASLGWWPAQIDPTTGETAPGVALVPPITQRFTMKCPQGHVVKVVPFAALMTPALCPSCQTHVTRETMLVERTRARTKGFEPVGAVAFDDLTSMLQWQMDDMAGRHARQEIKGEDSALGGRITSGDLVLGGNNRSHYGFVQTRAGEMVHNMLGIPGLSIPPIVAMLPLETMDEGGLSIVGPKLAGKAKTDEAGSWFGNLLEIGVVKDEQGVEVRRLSLNAYIDDQNRRHLIKHRGSPNMPPYLQDDAGQPWGQVNLGVFFALLEKDIQENAEETQQQFQNAPGLATGEMTYGEPVGTGPATNGTPASTAPQSPQPVAAGGVKPGRTQVVKPRAQATKPAQEVVAAVEPSATAALPLEPDPAVVQPGTPIPEAAPSATAPAPPVAAPTSAAPRPVLGARPGLAPPPGPRPPAVAPRRPPVAAPRPAAPVGDPVSS